MTAIVLTVTLTLAAVLFAYRLHLHFKRKDIPMITQNEQAIVDAVKGMAAKIAASDAAIAAANQAAADVQAALDAEKADHAELVSTLESLTLVVPAE